ncbi:TPA: hypothetical protein DHW58_02240 [Patescibacteria group bacterium]|uniref:UPF0102 protein VF00_C0001G0189 n=2 Tax=Bacteria division Kazan-3B-28 TaxID=1798534 RepID=A0A0G2A4T4_UNCK3|nr:MAG: hypothetical protein VE98_C0001G0583 [candidate division Kazan bacterium GW2011_GWA1_50_15]KKW25731.1 MAG: hypothetical protein VE99_C0001G0370 [candidate division Kazan bacterium GW2011_GWC1_52_13]KKW27254.1 MAG: hypothetical protein VF00_C0001G0189 [candidate division Kazan bacterium GW2011_GWB1_52_7]HAV65980.1 hypothetical protein [Patescibacteria group bacterium]HCL47788.1 hypothetical protein [Patescibacteria group bacterium]
MTNISGQWGEAKAAEYLRGLGYEIKLMNWRSRFGEVDIVAQEGGTVVFVEVKTRQRYRGMFGTPLDAITPDKVRRLSRLAADFSAQYKLSLPIRLDVVAVTANDTPRLIRGVEPIDINR